MLYIRVVGRDVPVAIPDTVVQVSIERAVIRTVVSVATKQSESYHESPNIYIYLHKLDYEI